MQNSKIESAEAYKALREINAVQQHSAALRLYNSVGGTISVWGLIWLLANVSSYFYPSFSAAVWIIGITIGAALSAYTGIKNQDPIKKPNSILQSVAIFIAIAIALTMLFNISNTNVQIEGNAMISMLVALAYCVAGIWNGLRVLIIGFALAVTVITGWYFLEEWFELWMGLIGGGLLILSGLWLRKA